MSGRLPPQFDRIAVVDWSANATPKTGADSIWSGVVERDASACRLHNFPTRAEALSAIAALAQPGERTLVGVDFSLGFPRGTASALGLAGWCDTWRALGDDVTDDDRNANNRFEVAAGWNERIGDGPGPFWGCPASRATPTLTATKPSPLDAWPPTWRHVEAALHDDGARPFSAWQLHGVGSVGSQSLVGIAALHRLRAQLDDRMAIWPFTTGLAPPGVVELVVAEVWPSLWPVDVPAGVVKDAAQVEATVRRLAAADRDGTLTGWFRPVVPADAVASVVAEEGWVLGVQPGSPGP